MQSYTEIPFEELSQYASNLTEALEAVCESPAFRTSPKSCEFLRHIVLNALSGKTDELKERLIGMSLLGREASYDTGSDSGVRVRANDVRKRLAAYSKAKIQVSSFAFELPSGSYVPHFYRNTTQSFPADGVGPVERYETDTPLSLRRLAAPTVVALFLCLVCIRWQIDQEHPFTTFWQHIFQGNDVRLYLPFSVSSNGHQLVAMQEIQATAPLLSLAGQFHGQLNLTGDAAEREGEVLISIGAPSQNKDDLRRSQAAGDNQSSPDTKRLTIVDTVDGRRVFDRSTSTIYPTHGSSAALLTVSNSPTPSIHIDGTDDASIGSLVRLLCERDTFPEGLAEGITDGTTSQMLLPMASGSHPIIFSDPRPAGQANMDKAQ
jgi:hypothetical protein